MTKKELLLACMGAAEAHPYEPVQIQKLVFLFQERAAAFFPARPFTFRPYDYGPFDPEIYSCLEVLATEGILEIVGVPFSRPRYYRLTEAGHGPANQALSSIPEPFYSFLLRLSKWVRSISFAQLVGTVYRDYPHMQVNSIFKG